MTTLLLESGFSIFSFLLKQESQEVIDLSYQTIPWSASTSSPYQRTEKDENRLEPILIAVVKRPTGWRAVQSQRFVFIPNVLRNIIKTAYFCLLIVFCFWFARLVWWMPLPINRRIRVEMGRRWCMTKNKLEIIIFNFIWKTFKSLLY